MCPHIDVNQAESHHQEQIHNSPEKSFAVPDPNSIIRSQRFLIQDHQLQHPMKQQQEQQAAFPSKS